MPDDIQPGHVGWVDLTVDNATEVRDFYRAVVGWEYREVEMDGYADFAMTNLEGRDVTGICHARGVNEGLPAQWMVYFIVLDLQFAVDEAVGRGGEILREPTDMGAGHCMEDCYEEVLDQAGLITAKAHRPSWKWSLPTGFEGMGTDARDPQLETHYVKSFTKASSKKLVITCTRRKPFACFSLERFDRTLC